MNLAQHAQQNVRRIIRNEHGSIAAVVSGLQHVTRLMDQGKGPPDLKAFHAMLLYLSDYPQRIHHPKEDRYLFERIRKRSSELDSMLAELEFQHVQGAGLLHDIEHALNRYEFEGQTAFPAFRDLVAEFAKFYIRHMRLEEEHVMPTAVRLLTDDDWVVIEAAFRSDRDPLADGLITDSMERLFTTIVNLTPSPSGLGTPLK